MASLTRGRLLVGAWYAIAAVVSAAVAVAVIAVWPAGAANGVPYTDTQSAGGIVFFDKDGRQIAGGLVSARPFVWRAVSSVKAPPPYDKQGRRATLLAFQPREGVQPADWSGDTLTASTPYTDPNTPTAQATERDFSLADYLTLFPVRWDGLLQVRMYLGAPEVPTLTNKYVTTDIRVTGDRWSIVRTGQTAGAPRAAVAQASGPNATANPVNGGVGGGGGEVIDAANASSGLATLPEMDTPRILIVAAASTVGVVLLGLVRRRRTVEIRG